MEIVPSCPPYPFSRHEMAIAVAVSIQEVPAAISEDPNADLSRPFTNITTIAVPIARETDDIEYNMPPKTIEAATLHNLIII